MRAGDRQVDVGRVLQGLGFDEWRDVGQDNILTQCPWPDKHSQGDHNASFSVNMKSGAWICYRGCGSGGMSRLVQQLQSVDEKGATRWMLRAGGGTVWSFDHIRRALPREGETAEDEAAKVARADYELMTDETTSSYFLDRGFTWDTIEEWGIRYDKGNKAIVVPIHSWRKEIVGICRRLVPPLPTGWSKYMYTEGFDRSRHLFAACKVTDARQPVIVVEGVLDAIWLHQHGYTSAVALMGTYCSTEQKRLLRRLSNRVVLALDNDEPGRTATEKLVERLTGEFMIRVAPEYDGKDVQDLDSEALRAVFL